MSPSYHAISLIKQSDMTKEKMTMFLLNVSKEVLIDYLINTKILNNPTRITKNKMIELIVSDGEITIDKVINILPINTAKMRITDK